MAQVLSGRVKNVLSADTLVLTPPKSTQIPVPERVLTLQYVRGDSFEGREFLKNLVTGKEVKFRVNYKLPTTGKEFGDVQAPIFASLIEYLLKHGMVKLKDNIKADSEAEDEFVELLKVAQAQAQASGVGVWAPKFSEPEIVPLSDTIIAQSQSASLPLVVERVISGDRLMGRIIINKRSHVQLPFILAGVRSPRTDDSEANLVKVANQAKQYVEDHLLTSKAALKATIVGSNQAGLPLILVEHPSGNSIHEKLLENGFAEIVDWQSSLVGASTMSTLRKAEQTAKALSKGMFASITAPRTQASTSSSKSLRPGNTIDSVVISKVVNGDVFNVVLPSNEEITVQLASLRSPRPNDTTVTSNSQEQQALVQMAREFSRNFAIGKSASMYIDGFREANKDLGLDSRFLVSLKIGSKDLSEALVANGFATVIRHNKQTASERSMNWDKLIEIEEEQKKQAKKGVFCTSNLSKFLTIGTRVVNASENATKSKTFLSGFQKKGRISGYYVEFIPSVNRVRLYNPKEGTKLTLVLGGLSNDRSAEGGSAGLNYMNRKFLQRNVEFDVYDSDKVGGFIGNLYANAQALQPVQTELLAAGLVSVHGIAVFSNKFSSSFESAESSAKSQHKGIWSNYDEETEKQNAEEITSKIAQLSVENTKPKFFDIEIVDIDKSLLISYHLIDTATAATFANFKREFNEFHSQSPSASSASVDLPFNLTKPPKKNEYVSAKYEGKYYRAKVINFDRISGKFDVKHVDFGNIDQVTLQALRGLPKKFGVDVVKPFAHSCKLQNISLPPNKPKDYLSEGLIVLEDLTFDKKLVLSGLPSTTAGVEYDAILYDSEQSLTDPSYTINKQLVSEGFGIVDTKCGDHLKEYVNELLAEQAKAKRLRTGCWELGDITVDDEF